MASAIQEYVLSPYQYRLIKKTALLTVLPILTGRQLLPLDPDAAKGAQEMTRVLLEPGTEEAAVIPKGGRYPLITPTENMKTVFIRKIGQAFVVTDEDLDSSQVTGRALDKRAIEIASRKLGEYEDKFIYIGDSNVGEVGLMGEAQWTQPVSYAWTDPACEPYEDVNNAVGKIEAAGFEVNYAVFNNTDYKLLRQEDSYGNLYLDKIIKNCGIPEANILKSFSMPKGQALFCDSGNDIAELKEVEPLTVMPPVRKLNDTLQINIREHIGIDVYQPRGFCTMTGIS